MRNTAVEDPRICAIDGEYLITYSAYSRHGVRVGLAKTRDFNHIERISLITQTDCRNIVIFSEKLTGVMPVLTGLILKFHPGPYGSLILRIWFTGVMPKL